MGNLGSAELMLIFMLIVICGIFVIIPFWKIFGKAGFPPGLSFLMIVPGLNVILLYVLAFSDWHTNKDQRNTIPGHPIP